MPPVVVDIELQRDNRRDRQRKAAQQQDAKAGFEVAQRGKRARDCLPANCRAADSAQHQRHRRRGDAEPHRDEVPRRGVGFVYLAHKQVLYNDGMPGQRSDAINEPQRVFPVVRVDGVHRCKRSSREYPRRR